MNEYTKYREIIHTKIYPTYMNDLLNIISEKLKCFSVDYYQTSNIIHVKIKKTDFKKSYKLISHENVSKLLDEVFTEYFNLLINKLDDLKLKGEIRNCNDSIPMSMHYSIVLLDNGYLEIRV